MVSDGSGREKHLSSLPLIMKLLSSLFLAPLVVGIIARSHGLRKREIANPGAKTSEYKLSKELVG
jgi:hypothetical protein